ncbi:MAG: hypothetical protein AAGJ83_06880 [Planctomycetota bacterium]
MKSQQEFTLELSDGTRFPVRAHRQLRHPDIKAFLLPAGSMTPFTENNLPTEQSVSEESERFSIAFQ